MKNILALILVIPLLACNPSAKNAGSVSSKGATSLIFPFLNEVAEKISPSGNSGESKTPTSDGGVDVGNMTTAIVPKTNASFTLPVTWDQEGKTEQLKLRNTQGSMITAERTRITELVSPNAVSLQKYLKSKFPDRVYNKISLNGLEGVRADIKIGDDEKQSDFYLVSELKDFIHVESHLKKSGGGITVGEAILSSVRIKYMGEAIAKAPIKTVELMSYRLPGDQRLKAAFTFKADCFSYVDRPCHGVSALFQGDSELTVGNGGYDSGRITELGKEQDVSFDSVKIDGKFLTAPGNHVPLADIYTVFHPKNQQPENSRKKLKEGFVYLVRTISWPDEDLLLKMRVEKIEPTSMTITYQKLAAVNPEILKRQVEEINEYTRKYEQPLNEGEMTIYNRSKWGNYHFAAFNFQYSTSGNMYITRNSWDLLFDNGCNGKPSFNVPHTGSAIGDVIEIPGRKLSEVQRSDFPNSNTYKRDCGKSIEAGKVYGIFHHPYSSEVGTVYGAVEVLEIASDSSWVRFKFRRIHLGPAEHFQEWIPLQIPQGPQLVQMRTNGADATFYPFINKLGSQGSHYYENIDVGFRSPEKPEEALLRTDSRPFADRGFYKLSPFEVSKLDTFTAKDFATWNGKYKSYTDVQKGEVYAVNLENYHDRTLLFMTVTDVLPGKGVTLTLKYISREKTPYSDDKE